MDYVWLILTAVLVLSTLVIVWLNGGLNLVVESLSLENGLIVGGALLLGLIMVLLEKKEESLEEQEDQENQELRGADPDLRSTRHCR
jgi:NADH:ubiquinone oxidoreductase subunit 6 (subunit J)